MEQYRIVSRNKRPTGRIVDYPVYYAQRKFLGLFWIDCYSLLNCYPFDAYDRNIECVREYIKQKMMEFSPIKQEVVEVYESIEDIP